MVEDFTITNVENMSNEKADEINKAAEDIDSLIDVLKGQEKNKYRNKNVAHRGFNADREVTIAFLNAVKGISTIEDEKYKFFIEPISKIKFDTTLQNIRKGNYGKMDEIKTAQKSINAYMKEYGLSVEVDTTLREKRDVTKIINSIKWKRGEDYNKKREGEKDYEISINKEGKGSISFYSNDEKLKTVEFQIGKDGKIVFDKTTLYQILEDGWLGVETLRALSVVLNDIAERNRVREEEVKPIPIPVKKEVVVAKVSLSTSGFYQRKEDGRLAKEYIGSSFKKRFEEHADKIDEKMTKVNYKEQREIYRGDSKTYTNPRKIFQEYYFNNDRKVDEKGYEEGVLKPFNKDVTSQDGKVGEEFIVEVDKKNRYKEITDIDFSEIKKDFDAARKEVEKNIGKEYRELHIDFLNKLEMEISIEILDIMDKSKNSEEFIKKLNESGIQGKYLGVLRNYLHMPGEFNTFETDMVPYIIGGEKVEETFRMIEEASKINKNFKIYIDDIDGDKFISLKDMKKNDRDLFMLYFNIKDINDFTNSYARVINKEKAIVETETKKEQFSEDKKPKRISMMEAKKIPTQKDLDALKENIKSSPALAKLYKNWYNEEMKKAGLKGRIDEKNPTKEFDRMGIDFWHQIKKPEEIMEKHLVEYKKEAMKEMKDQFSLDSEFEKYVRMRTYEGKGEFDLQLNELNEDIKKKIAWDRYGIDFMLRDQKKVDKGIEKTRKEIMDDKVECMAFQLFVNEYLGSRGNIKVDGIPGNITKKYMKEPDLLTLYYHMRENNAKERDRLLTVAKETEQKVTIAKK